MFRAAHAWPDQIRLSETSDDLPPTTDAEIGTGQRPLPAGTLPALFRMAIVTGVKAAVRLHLRRGANVNAADKAGRTPLVLAAGRGHAGICEMLLDAGAEPAVRDQQGNDALSIATRSGHEDVARLIRSRLLPPELPVPSEVVGPSAADMTPSGGLPDRSLAQHELEARENEGTRVVPDEGPFDLSGWEEVSESPPPVHDLSCILDARQLQKDLSAHVAIDTAEDWLDVDVDLPELRASRRWATRDGEAVWRAAASALILECLQDGWVTEERLARAAARAQQDDLPLEDNLAGVLRVALGDMGILVNDLPASMTWALHDADDEDHEQTLLEGDQDLDLNEALSFIGDLQADNSDPLAQFVREMGPKALLSREEEGALAQEIAEGFAQACAAIALSRAAMAEFLDCAGRVEKGDQPLRFMIGNVSSKNDDPGTQAVSPRSGQIVREAGDPQGDETTDDPDADDLSAFSEKMKTIRYLSSRLFASITTSEDASVAGKLGKEIAGLGLSDDFVRRLWKIVDLDTSAGAARDSLASGLNRARQARNRFAVSNMRLVLWVARRYRGLPLMDLVQEGSIGMLRAIDRFDPAHGAKFSTYATWWIRQSITRAVADKSRLIRVPVHMLETMRKVENARNVHVARTGRDPDPKDLADALDISAHQVRQVRKVPSDPCALDAFPNGSLPLEQEVPDRTTPSPEDTVIRLELKSAIRKAIDALSGREAQVIRLRFGLDGHDEHTLEEVGQIQGVTRERIRQIEAKALKKLSHPGRARRLLAFLGSGDRGDGFH